MSRWTGRRWSIRHFRSPRICRHSRILQKTKGGRAMVIRNFRGSRRWGAMAIETALVMIPTVMFLFGVFEFGRLLMDWNVLNNAAREGCRYALVDNTSATVSTDVQTVVNKYMG